MDTQRSLNNWLHFFAAIVLLLFSVSHFMDLIMGDPSHRLDNTVFPFFTNKTMFLFAGFFELIIGMLCMRLRGRDSANVVILFFVIIIMWYRWAFSYTGGYRCGCAGVLRKVLHLPTSAEKIASTAALIFLFLMTTPWLFRNIRGGLKRFGWVTALLLLLIGNQEVHASQTIEIRGEYWSSQYNPIKQIERTNSRLHASFEVAISGDAFRICATNLGTGRWSQFIYDGTNSYAFDPYEGLFAKTRPESNLVYACISPSPRFLRGVDNKLQTFLPWMTYIFSPALAVTNNSGIVEIPLPWAASRNFPGTWGFKWLVNFPSENRFLQDCQFVRDASLDLDEELEFRRPDLNAPQTVADQNVYRDSLRWRKEIQNGFVSGQYECKEWYQTNGVSFPMESELKRFSHPNANFPFYKANLKATSITMSKTPAKFVAPPNALTFVQDYRYRKIVDGRHSDFTEYDLQSGEPWKSDRDPALVDQMQKNLEVGVKGFDLSKNILVWVALAVVLFIPMAAMLWVKWGQSKTNNTR